MTRNPNLPIQSTADPIRVSLVTRDPLLRTGITSLLAQAGPIDVVDDGTAEVALWDAGTGGDGAVDKLGELRTATVPTVAIVTDSTHVAAALAAGARGVVLRDAVGPGLHAALTAVRSGLTVIDTALAAGLVPAQVPMKP